MQKTISVKNLEIGMCIYELKRSWMDHPLWPWKFPFSDPVDLEEFLNSNVNEVVIDTSLWLDFDIETPDYELTERE